MAVIIITTLEVIISNYEIIIFYLISNEIIFVSGGANKENKIKNDDKAFSSHKDSKVLEINSSKK